MISGVEAISFSVHGDNRGKLIAVEGCNDVDFDIQRIYYIYDTLSGIVRGKHAHIDLKQVMICVCGSCKVLVDNGAEHEIVKLDSPDRGIYIHDLIWREMMEFSTDCVLLVLVNRPYDAGDYIYDYDAFKDIAQKRRKETL